MCFFAKPNANPFMLMGLMAVLIYSQPALSQQATLPGPVINRLEKNIPILMKRDLVPGLTAALILDGKIVWTRSYGYLNASTQKPVTDKTIFEAASLTKVVTSYAVLKMVDQGLLNLDSPLNKYLGNNYEVGDDARINGITARHVLTHSSGFPNWRPNNSKILPILFNPGERWSYSGEGFVYLSKVAEKISRMPFDKLVMETVFRPLKMENSSLIWKNEYDSTKIFRHNWLGEVSYKDESKWVNAAASMHTSAEDYAKFMITVLNGHGLSKAAGSAMLSIQFKANEKSPEVAWGLGVGLENTKDGNYLWHWGDQGDSKCYMVADLERKNGFVYFTNSANGLSIAPELLDMSIGGSHPALVLLNYPKHNPDAVVFYQTIINKGVKTALVQYNSKKKSGVAALPENTLNSIGYQLIQAEKIDEAIEVWKQNTIDFPNSANTWDSLAEGYMTLGDNVNAIRCYEKAIALDPKNSNAVEMVKKLKTL
jgi:CubicO group peptidase (beta-lactamase class C family)